MFEIDWHQVFGIDKSILELFVRGTAMYWFLFAIFRFIMRREVGGVGIADVLIIVIIADASQNAMTDEYDSVTEGFVVVGTLIFWNVVTNWAGFHWRGFERFAEPPPLPLIRDGRVLEHNLKREWLTREELMSKLRQHGVEKPEEVRWAYMESDGQLSVRKLKRAAARPVEAKVTNEGRRREYKSDARVDLDDPQSVAYWSRELGISEERLRAAVRKVGPKVDEVRGEAIGS